MNGSEGMFISGDMNFLEWTGVSHPDLLGFESDFAMRINILPAPGAAALFGIGALLIRPRRRRHMV